MHVYSTSMYYVCNFAPFSSFTDLTSCPIHILVWACMVGLCSPLHGDHMDQLLLEVFKHLVPVVAMVTGEGKVCPTPIPSPLVIRSEHAVSFIRYMQLLHMAISSQCLKFCKLKIICTHKYYLLA